MRITERCNDLYVDPWPRFEGAAIEHQVDRVRVVQVRAEPGDEGQMWSLYRISRSEGSMASHADGGVVTIRDVESGEMVGLRKMPTWAAAEEYFGAELRRARRTAIPDAHLYR